MTQKQCCKGVINQIDEISVATSCNTQYAIHVLGLTPSKRVQQLPFYSAIKQSSEVVTTMEMKVHYTKFQKSALTNNDSNKNMLLKNLKNALFPK